MTSSQSLVTALLGSNVAEPQYTEEEARNLEVIRQSRAAKFEDRANFQASNYTPHRRGFASMARRAEAAGGVGYSHASLEGRVDEILDIIAKGDRVWAVWTLRGIHAGELCGFPPTGRTIEATEMAVWRLVDGKIVEAWFFADELGLLDQLTAGAAEPA